MNSKGTLFIVSGPSGAGKTTLSNAALESFPALVLSVSCTTRAPRGGEEHGREYLFVEGPEFDRMIAAGELAEWAEVHGHRYGTPRGPIDAWVAAGRDVLLDIDVQGAAQMRRTYPEAVTVFLLPPDRATLEQRLRGRGTDDEAVVRRRLENACREISRALEYDHVIVNRSREDAIAEFEAIVREARAVGRSAMARRRAGMDERALAAFVASFDGAA